MSKIYIENKTFQGIDFSVEKIEKAEYENCTFNNCEFSNTDLSNINFSECEFTNCNLSMAKIRNTVFRDVKFKNSKLLGLHFQNCNEFLLTVEFEACLLNLSSFFKRKLKNTKFKDCSLQEVDFAETDLTNSLFDNCNLSGAIFEQSNIEKCDFRTSYNYIIDPENNKISKAKFSQHGIAGLLNKYNIDIF